MGLDPSAPAGVPDRVLVVVYVDLTVRVRSFQEDSKNLIVSDF